MSECKGGDAGEAHEVDASVGEVVGVRGTTITIESGGPPAEGRVRKIGLGGTVFGQEHVEADTFELGQVFDWACKNMCGCGSPEEAGKFLLEYLEVFSKVPPRLHELFPSLYGPGKFQVDEDKEPEPAKMVDYDKVKAFEEKYGVGCFNLLGYFLCNQDITEHGGAVYSSWLTDLGLHVRDCLRHKTLNPSSLCETCEGGKNVHARHVKAAAVKDAVTALERLGAEVPGLKTLAAAYVASLKHEGEKALEELGLGPEAG